MIPQVPPRDESLQPVPDSGRVAKGGVFIRRATNPERSKVILFTIFGGGLMSLACGGGLGVLRWLFTKRTYYPLAGSFGYGEEFNRHDFFPVVVETIVIAAPILMLICALAAVAQVLINGMNRAVQRAGKVLADRLGGVSEAQRSEVVLDLEHDDSPLGPASELAEPFKRLVKREQDPEQGR